MSHGLVMPPCTPSNTQVLCGQVDPLPSVRLLAAYHLNPGLGLNPYSRSVGLVLQGLPKPLLLSQGLFEKRLPCNTRLFAGTNVYCTCRCCKVVPTPSCPEHQL